MDLKKKGQIRLDVKGFDRIRPTKFGNNKVCPEGVIEPRNPWVIDPGSDFSLNWNRIFLFSCLVALFLDPLFFYLPTVVNDSSSETSSCMTVDLNLGITITLFRSLADLFYAINVVIQFRTAYVSPTSTILGRGELVMDLGLISRRYWKSKKFWVDLFAAFPLPQVVIWFILPSRSAHADHTNNFLLVTIMFAQYIIRLFLIFPLCSYIIKTTGVVTNTAWAGAAYNLLLYMIASHILGAFWYLLSFRRDDTCLKAACREERGCSHSFLDCDTLGTSARNAWVNSTAVFSHCNPDDTTFFNFGIFGDAVSKSVLSANFVEKYFYCLWWGLRNLSSYGQGLMTSTYAWESIFAILISLISLVLFALLIGNMQTYAQSLVVRLEEWRLKRRDIEEWMEHRNLPQDIMERVRSFHQYKWQATRGVDEESLLHSLPADVRRDIQRHLCLDLVLRVPFFSQMDAQLLDAICERLVSSLCTKGSYIVREGDPVTEMLFIIRGTLESSTTNGGRANFFNSITLESGDFCGEELLTWALLPTSYVNLASSTRTVKALTEVEAFALRAEDLKFVANQFRRLHSKKLQHTFRHYSHQWRTWAACIIQNGWRRYKKRKLALSLFEYEQLQEGDGSQSSPTANGLGVTILASRFYKNTRRGAQKGKEVDLPKFQKPVEPDFSAEVDDE